MKKNNKTKEKIIQVTTNIIEKNGDFTFKEVTEIADVNIAAINYHFGNKDNLIYEILERKINCLKTILIVNFKIDIKTLDKEIYLNNFLNYLFDFALENKNILKFIFSNNTYINQSAEIFVKNFTNDVEFNNNLLNFVNEFGLKNTPIDLKIKYLQVCSSFCFPLILNINEKFSNAIYIYSIEDANFRKNYIKQMTNFLLNN